MIATVHVADVGRRALLHALRNRPDRADIAGLRWAEVAPAAALASFRPPGLRRGVLFAMFDDRPSAESFCATHPLARRFADDGFQAMLRPLRAYGSWPGLPTETPRRRVTDHDGPLLVTTLGRLRISQTPRFLAASRPAERAVVAADGLVWACAATRPPFVATLSVWSDERRTAAYAYGDPASGHPQAIRRQQKKDFHHESAFIRYAIVSATGALPGGATIPRSDGDRV